MSPELIGTYRARHPNAVLIESEYPHCAAALNALFGREVWVRDEDIVDDEPQEMEVTDDNRVVPVAPREGALVGPRDIGRLPWQWRAPTETLSGPCSLWREEHVVVPNREEINALRAQLKQPMLPDDSPHFQPKSYTAYTLVCAVDKLGDADFQLFTRMCDRHNLSLGVASAGDKVLVQLAVVR